LQASQKEEAMLKIGTSGYSYADWKGFFYPEKIKQGDMLPTYAAEFNTVEINYTLLGRSNCE
jgi:uncharacterized protein YecE (DUF72 family)